MWLVYFSLGLLVGLMILPLYVKMERKRWKEKFEKERVHFEYRINHDSLTGIYNRDFFESRCLRLNEIENTSVAILVCDLDELKTMNDTYGHKQGDALIKNAAWVLQEFSSEDVTVARLGGDEFVFLVTGKSKGEAKHLVSSIINRVNEYNANSNIEMKISIGFAFSPNSIGQMTRLFAQADKNMYANKNERKLVTCAK
jgi:diguanylate cyclase (GGDEF)-like protein